MAAGDQTRERAFGLVALRSKIRQLAYVNMKRVRTFYTALCCLMFHITQEMMTTYKAQL